MEEWKDIPDYQGLYQVSDLGNIRSLRFGKIKLLKLKNKLDKKIPRQDIGLTDINGEQKTKSVHRLVLITFNPIPNMNDMEVDHIDENRLNNKLSNLQWVTPGMNKSLYHKRNNLKTHKICPHCNQKVKK